LSSSTDSPNGTTAKNSSKVKVLVNTASEKQPLEYQAEEGESVYDLVLKNPDQLSPYLECACRGITGCSTCHVYVDPKYFDKLPPPTQAELDMLDLAWGFKEEASRLGCQIKFTKDLDGITVTVPDEANNLYPKQS
jgi:ferredoxin